MTILDTFRMEYQMTTMKFKRIFSKIFRSFVETARERKEKEKTQIKTNQFLKWLNKANKLPNKVRL